MNTFDEVEAVRGLHRVLHLAISVSSAAFPGSHSAIVGSQVVTLIPGPHQAAAETFTQAMVRVDNALIAGIGRRANDINGIARSYREAGAVAGALMSSPRHDRDRHALVATFDEMRDRLAILQVGDLIEGLDAAVGDAASILAAHDAAQGTDLTRTVRVYLDQLGSVRETANALHVHQKHRPVPARCRAHRAGDRSRFARHPALALAPSVSRLAHNGLSAHSMAAGSRMVTPARFVVGSTYRAATNGSSAPERMTIPSRAAAESHTMRDRP